MNFIAKINKYCALAGPAGRFPLIYYNVTHKVRIMTAVTFISIKKKNKVYTCKHGVIIVFAKTDGVRSQPLCISVHEAL